MKTRKEILEYIEAALHVYGEGFQDDEDKTEIISDKIDKGFLIIKVDGKTAELRLFLTHVAWKQFKKENGKCHHRLSSGNKILELRPFKTYNKPCWALYRYEKRTDKFTIVKIFRTLNEGKKEAYDLL